MHASRWLGVLLALGAPPVLLLSTACKPPAAPGTAVGTFTIDGRLSENTCGQGFSPPVSVRFQAELRRSGTSAYWKMGDAPRAQGTIDADGDFVFNVQQQIDGWAADPANGIPACRFVQTETIAGNVAGLGPEQDAGASDVGVGDAGFGDGADAGAVVHVMSATNTIEVAVVPGFDCSLALVSTGAGGQFPSLPCHAAYEFAGTTGE